MALDDILLEAEEKMEKTEQVVINEFSGVRTGKASSSLNPSVWRFTMEVLRSKAPAKSPALIIMFS